MSQWKRVLRISTRLYRWMLWCYPRHFRRKYASEMTGLFYELAEDAVRAKGCAGFLMFWGRMVPDLGGSCVEQHYQQLRRSYHMFQTWSRYTRYWLALVVTLTIAMFVTPADPVSQLIVALPFFFAYVGADLLRSRRPAQAAEHLSKS